MHTILFDCPCHIFCSGPLSICIRVSHAGAWGLVGSHLGLAHCIPTISAISYQFLSILGAPGWETTCLLGPSFWCLQLGIGGPHTKATLAINMKCAKNLWHFDETVLLPCHMPLTHQPTFLQFGQQHAPLFGA